ncbi:hypothetical protein WDU94_002218 [Cyamophila willieti]
MTLFTNQNTGFLLLLLTSCHLNDAAFRRQEATWKMSPKEAINNFTMAEFVNVYSDCFVTNLGHMFRGVELPIDKIQHYLKRLSFYKVTAVVHSRGIPDTHRVHLNIQKVYRKCFRKFRISKGLDEASLRIMLREECTCDSIRDNNKLPNLPCDAIAKTVFEEISQRVPIDRTRQLYIDNGFNFDLNNIAEEVFEYKHWTKNCDVKCDIFRDDQSVHDPLPDIHNDTNVR